MYNSATNVAIGTVQIQPAKGGAPVVVPIGTPSPFVYAVTKFGNLLVGNGQVEVSRDNATYYQASLVGGYLFVEPGDFVRITWYGATPPQVVFFPYS
jgi:hypothetical protein